MDAVKQNKHNELDKIMVVDVDGKSKSVISWLEIEDIPMWFPLLCILTDGEVDLHPIQLFSNSSSVDIKRMSNVQDKIGREYTEATIDWSSDVSNKIATFSNKKLNSLLLIL